MKKRISLILFMLISLLLIIVLYEKGPFAQEKKIFVPDKALCAKMLRFGKLAYIRGKYLDAKEYFRKAVQADPTSMTAWRYYDLATIFALAEKVEKNANFVAPDVSKRPFQTPEGGAPQAPPPVTQQKQQDTGFKIVDDEGC